MQQFLWGSSRSDKVIIEAFLDPIRTFIPPRDLRSWFSTKIQQENNAAGYWGLISKNPGV